MSYNAVVAKIHTRPHPNANKLQLGTCLSYQVVVGLDTTDGELGVFFPCDGQLSEEFVLANHLYTESARLKLGLINVGIVSFGFFSDKRRVRAQNFRGEKSDGFWCPLSYFNFLPILPYVDLKEGDTFYELGGAKICNKYFTPATMQAQGKIGRKQRENKCFPKHDVTKQFKHVAESIPTNAVYYITEKLHGTSGRYGYVRDNIDLSWYKRWINKLVPMFGEQEYHYLNGSKNVILEKTIGLGYYGTNEFRYKAIENISLHKGEVLYFEIVGWVGDRPIMEPHPIKDEVKSLRKTFGETMTYKYGLLQGSCDIYVYRIVHINEDGVVIDLSWPQVTARCKELGLKTVPLLVALMGQGGEDSQNALRTAVEAATEGKSTLDESHIREGCVLRVEAPDGTSYIKNKSWYFGVLEGYIKDSEDYIDTEEAS